jgi:hypothetical protein
MTPASVARVGVANRTSRSSSSIRPSFGPITPAMIFIRVDFPAPFSPSTAWIEPARTARLALCSATVAP